MKRSTRGAYQSMIDRLVAPVMGGLRLVDVAPMHIEGINGTSCTAHEVLESLLSRAKEKGVMTHASRSTTKDSWIPAGAGRAGLNFIYNIWMDDEAGVELYIVTGNQEENKAIFSGLESRKNAIEQAFGAELSWERLDEKRASRIRYLIRKGGLNSGEARWPEIQDATIDAMARLSKALKPHLLPAAAGA